MAADRGPVPAGVLAARGDGRLATRLASEAELVRQVSRMADEWHALMAAELIGAELHRYAAATRVYDERWTVQLTELGVTLRSLDAGLSGALG